MSLEDYAREKRVHLTSTAETGTEGLNLLPDFRTEKVELADITEKERWGDRPIISLTSARHQAKAEIERFSEYALVLRRYVDQDGDRLKTALEVRSSIIRACLKENLQDYPYLNIHSTPIVIYAPYPPLFHYRKQIREYCDSPERTEDEKTHLSLLVTFMNNNLQALEKECFRLLPSGMITFELMWTLFPPDTLIIAQRDHYNQCFSVDSYDFQTYLRDQEEVGAAIIARSWDYNGHRFGPALKTFEIKQFDGPKAIEALEVHPIEFYSKSSTEELKASLSSRGHRWKEIVDVSHRAYNGVAWGDPLTAKANQEQDLVPVHISGRIIVDYNTHQQARPELGTVLMTSGAMAGAPVSRGMGHARSGPPGPPRGAPPRNGSGIRLEYSEKSEAQRKANDKYLSYPNTKHYKMTDEQALLCPARIRGFSLVEKSWNLFLVEQVEEVQWSENAFENLVLEEESKNMVQALVTTHHVAGEGFDDIIKGKGKGLIFLLYGPPGSGKTLTAESIAEKTRKPLYAVTSGELGLNDIYNTDRELRRIFSRGKAWSAILLLDEADVFLAKRSQTDLGRNAFVSIFLRLIEYYEGILFLTTNRVEDFDEAFQSRIHLTIRYDSLGASKRKAIWSNLLDLARPDIWDERTLTYLAENYLINGREIKNLIRTASTIARCSGRSLTLEFLQSVYKTNYEGFGGRQSLAKVEWSTEGKFDGNV